MICDAFFLTNSAKTPLYLHYIEGSALHLLLSQPVGRGFEPGSSHTFFAIRLSRKISRCLAGVLFMIRILFFFEFHMSS